MGGKDMEYVAGKYDVAVIGGGHAGCEAALACARMGLETILFSISMDGIASMPCNPSVGGTAKGHLVREIDALGGEMGKVADKTMIQSKILNRAKGPAVYSLRVQVDRKKYAEKMKETLDKEPKLHVRQGEVVQILTEGDDAKAVTGVKILTGAIFLANSVILTTGTYLKSNVVMGEISYSSGPDGLFPSNVLSDNLKALQIDLLRFKTGTPARVSRRSIDFSKMERIAGDENINPFSFDEETLKVEQADCYLTYTTEKTHEIIRNNLSRSPMFSGEIKGVGPRYCPSIEDKIVRFADKERHQIFVEPMGMDSEEMYLQGLSSSLPEDVYHQVLRSIPGLENVVVTRSAYAIEYDCINPQQLKLSLEHKTIQGLFFAGQINGTSGYEEAAAQGIMAGINAALKIKAEEPLVLARSQAYIGVLIDDLVTKGTNEPYRMMTSRAEYRLLLRQDNADKRLTPIGHQIGLVTADRYQRLQEKWDRIHTEIERLKKTTISPSKENNAILTAYESTPITTGIKLSELLKRPELTFEVIKQLDEASQVTPASIALQVEIEIKYEGYITRQMQQVEQFKKMEDKKIPEEVNYLDITGLRIEARQKLSQIKPSTLGQASRISGVSPADITVLQIFLNTMPIK